MREREDILTTVHFCQASQRIEHRMGYQNIKATKGGRCLSSTKCSVDAILTTICFCSYSSWLTSPSLLLLLTHGCSTCYVWPLAFVLAPNCCLTFSSCLIVTLPPGRNLLAFNWSLLIPFQVTKSSHSLYTACLPACLCSDTHSDSFSLGQAWVAVGGGVGWGEVVIGD